MDNIIEWIGYIASLIILVSLLMKSIKRLRLINLIGALIFAFYGYQIASPPVMVMNLGIAFINIYYLKQIYVSRDYFTILPFYENEEYARELIDYHKTDIERFMPLAEKDIAHADFRFLILRNMNPAGIFIARKKDGNTLEILLDYATPAFQDFKTGAHIYQKEKPRFKQAGFNRLIAVAKSDSHEKYLKKMGFTLESKNGRPVFTKTL